MPKYKKEQNYTVKAVNHNWSEYQKAIFKNIAKDEGHLIIEAYAGSAKTTSIIESFKYVPKGKKVLALAFNKKIQEELKARSPSYIQDIFTFHSLGLRAIKQKFGNIQIDDNKVFNIVKSQFKNEANYDLIINICDTVAYCKYGLVDAPSQIEGIIDRFSIDLCDTDKDGFIKTVIKVLGLDKADTSKVDFNDMCWFPFVYNLNLGQYDFVYVDERQDLNKSQLIMAKKACKPITGRIIAAGDEFQALYSWRMADTSIIEDIKKQDKTKTLSLPISYRCPKNIINLAKFWIPDIKCPDSAIDGSIIDISINQIYDKAKPGCFILSRTNAPLIKICMGFIRQGIKANIKGRDVGRQLNSLIRKSKKKQIKSFLSWLEKWRDDELEKLKDKNLNPENIIDRYECLVNICDESKSIEEVESKISELFNDNDENNIVILSTTHRAKGLERDDVFILKWTFKYWLDESLKVISKPNEECNIAYVAATRTKNRLFLVSKF